jgi:hypothetical protein
MSSKSADGDTTDELHETVSPSIEETEIGRRAMMIASAGAVATAAGVGTVSAQESFTPDYTSSLISDTLLESTVEIGQLDLSEMDPLQYIDDDGETSDLEDDGWSVRERKDADPDVDPTPHNPVSLSAAEIDSTEYKSFPRGETFDESGDGDKDTDVSILDVTHWSKDASGSNGSGSISDQTSPADGPGLRVEATQSTSDSIVFSFDSSYVSVESGEDRKRMQLVVDVDTLATDTTVRFRAIDEDGDYREALIDTAEDETTDSVIASGTGSSIVYDTALGDIAQTNNGDGNFNNLSEVEIHVDDGDATVDIFGMNLERESEWQFGDEEVLNSDDEIETNTITEPSGSFAINSIESIPAPLDSATLSGVSIDVEQRGSDLPSEWQQIYSEDSPSGYDRERRLAQGHVHLMRDQYALSWSSGTLYLVGGLPSSRYIEVGHQTNVDPVPETRDELIEDISYIDDSGSVSVGDDTENELANSVLSGEYAVVLADIVLSSDELAAVEQSVGATGAAGAAGGGGGILSTGRGAITAVAAVVGGLIAWLRARAP